MTDHLDLEAIKGRHQSGLVGGLPVTWTDLRSDVSALISEVERLRGCVEGLERDVEFMSDSHAERERVLETALRFYADPENHALDDRYAGWSFASADEGQRARDALSGWAALSESPTETKGENG